MAYYAVIKNLLVEGIIIADADFLPLIADKYDHIIEVEDTRPEPGDSYYPETNSFISNKTSTNHIEVDMCAEHLTRGCEEGFEPFKISKYSVSYADGLVVIGCKAYSAAGLLDSLHKVLIEKQTTTNIFTVLENGPAHGKFAITWEDAQKLYEVLSKVKLQ